MEEKNFFQAVVIPPPLCIKVNETSLYLSFRYSFSRRWLQLGPKNLGIYIASS